MTHRLHTLQTDRNGYVLVVTMFLLLLLTVIGIAATRTSFVELRIAGNCTTMIQDFYASEGALITVMEHTEWWLNDGFLNSAPGSASWSDTVDIDGDGADDATVEIRCIEPSPSVIGTISAAANNIPADRHTAPPPIASGYSVRHFYARKYAVTVTGLRSNTILQTGAWKAFNKY